MKYEKLKLNTKNQALIDLEMIRGLGSHRCNCSFSCYLSKSNEI